MNKSTFIELVDGDSQLPDELSPPLKALFLGRRGAWETSHDIANALDTPLGSWIHAWLHRVEGDLSNASYWYRLAGRPDATGELENEWEELAEAALAADPSV